MLKSVQDKAAKRPELSGVFQEFTAELKKELRSIIKKQADQAVKYEECDEYVYFREDGETIVEYRKCWFENFEEACEWCSDYYSDNQVHSMYDCTGQRFIRSIRFAHMRDNIYFIRIVWGLDI